MRNLVRTETSKSQHTITTTVLAESSKTRQDLAEIIKRMSSEPPRWQQRQKLLKSLKYESMGDRLDQIPQPHEGTYQWIMRGIRPWIDEGQEETTDQDQPQPKLPSDCPHETSDMNLPWRCFPCWLDSSNSAERIYWIQGKAGSGKSTLMKFLVSERSLWSELASSKSDPIILSHFFWAAGHHIQKSIRGLLLSLLSQFLSINEHLLDEVLDAFPGAKFKDMHGDWSLEDMQTIVETWFAKSTKPIFIFLDGLDEVDTDDMMPQYLLMFISRRLAKIKSVKVCVSSRPEPVYKTFLSKEPTLQLQDLTQIDMRQYIDACLLQARPDLEGTPRELNQLAVDLLEMADGVFLWVALAVRSLCRGLMNGDTFEEIEIRLHQMPQGLQSLYQNMWSRLNEDQAVYREEAALYINLVLEWGEAKLPFVVKLFHCLVASQPPKMEAILNDYTAFSSEELDSLCRETAKRVETRTAGLLEVAWDKGGNVRYVGIVHRSALEFFRNTVEGQAILRHDRTPSQSRRKRLLQSYVAELWVRVTGHYVPGRGFSIDDTWVPLDSIHFAWDAGHITRDDALELFSSCKRLYETGKWSTSTAATPLNADFAHLAALYGLHRLVSSMVNDGSLGFVKKPLSPLYRDYLLIAALLPARVSISEAVDGPSKSKVVEILLTANLVESNYDLKRAGAGTGKLIPTKDDNETPNGGHSELMVLMYMLNHTDAWPTCHLRLPDAIKGYVAKCRHFLDEKVFVIFTRDTSYDESNDENVEEWAVSIRSIPDSSMRVGNFADLLGFVALEMSIVPVVELFLLFMASDDEDPDNADTCRRVLQELKERYFHHFKRYVKVAVFHAPKEFSYRSLPSNMEEFLVRYPSTEEDSSRIMSCLGNVHRKVGGKGLQVPGLWEYLQELESRSNTITLGSFKKTLDDNPLNKLAAEFMANPPKPYAE